MSSQNDRLETAQVDKKESSSPGTREVYIVTDTAIEAPTKARWLAKLSGS